MKMIERIARQTVNEFWSEEIDDEFVTMINVIVERIDADRRKDAVAIAQARTFGEGCTILKLKELQDGDQLFLTPTIPEGMALAPDPVRAKNAPECLNFNDKQFWAMGWNECRDSMIAAAQGERNGTD